MTERRNVTSLVVDDTVYATTTTPKFERRKPYVPSDPRQVLAFIPGVIQMIRVAPGQTVRWGDGLLVLEAMKMKNDITSPRDGIVKAVHVEVGEMVAKGQLLVELE